MNERRLHNMIQAKQEWERQLRLINALGSGKPGVTKWQCESQIITLDGEIKKEKES